MRLLNHIYEEMRLWARDGRAVPRNLDAVNPFAELMIVAEATGPRTVRLSGVNYFDSRGRLGRTGRYLEEILRCLNYTLYPQMDIAVVEGVIRSFEGGGRQTGFNVIENRS